MSADNAFVVWEIPYKGWGIVHVHMSPFDEDCLYLQNANPEKICESRSEALVFAHDEHQKIYTEYGVVESTVPDKPCGRCWTCVHERLIIDEDINRCTRCENPITDNDWMVMTHDGLYHRQCHTYS